MKINANNKIDRYKLKSYIFNKTNEVTKALYIDGKEEYRLAFEILKEIEAICEERDRY